MIIVYLPNISIIISQQFFHSLTNESYIKFDASHCLKFDANYSIELNNCLIILGKHALPENIFAPQNVKCKLIIHGFEY